MNNEKFFNITYVCRESGKEVGRRGFMSGPNMKVVVERFLDNHKDEEILELTFDELREDEN